MANAGRAKRTDNPPVDCDAERALIAAILLGNGLPKQDVKFAAILKAIGKDDDLGTTAFVDERMRTIYKHMRRLHLQKKPPGDITLLIGALKDAREYNGSSLPPDARRLLDGVTLTSLFDLHPVWWNWRDYLDRVIEMRRRRRALHRGNQLIHAACATPTGASA